MRVLHSRQPTAQMARPPPGRARTIFPSPPDAGISPASPSLHQVLPPIWHRLCSINDCENPFVKVRGLEYSLEAFEIKRATPMLSWALTFLVIALIAGVFGFGGVAGTATQIAQILFFLFLVLFVVSLIFGRTRTPVT